MIISAIETFVSLIRFINIIIIYHSQIYKNTQIGTQKIAIEEWGVGSKGVRESNGRS
jgi:hypothetical protein